MNKKLLVIAAMATALSVSAANASDISGFSQTSGTFNIDPAKVNGDVGYRAYENFNLSEGDIANLIYRYKEGTASQRDIETFINLVQNQVNINGILNSVRDGKFHDGHAVFVSPNGMVVGASGVINVGTLSVATPTLTDFNSLKSEYNAGNFTNINQVSQLKKSGNAPISVNGYIFAKNGVDLVGNNINVSGNIVNGIKNQSAISSLEQAEALFNQLVNTDGTIKADSTVINPDGSLVFLHQTGAKGGINVSGNVVNLTQGTAKNGSVAITNNGADGLTVSGNVAANGKLSLYNKSGDMTVSGSLVNKNGELSIANSANAANMTLTSKSNITNTKGDVSIINKGKGALTSAGAVSASNDLAITNAAGGALNISGDNKADTIRIVNHGNGLVFAGSADAVKSVSIRNYGKNAKDEGALINGTIKAGEGVLVDNFAGTAVLNGTIDVTKGDVAIANRENAGALSTGTSSDISTTGRIAIRNYSKDGMILNGDITNNKGEIAINNDAGSMTVNGVIQNNDGNMGIINRGTGKAVIGADINNNGKLKLANVSGSSFEINDSVINKNGNFNIYNESGELIINGDIQNTDGYLYILSRDNSKGIKTSTDSSIAVSGGNLAIKHTGTGTAKGEKGMDLNGLIMNTDSETAINNYNGDMHVGGLVIAGDNLGIINRAGGEDMTVDADIAAAGTITNIKNDGSGDMTVAGDIAHKGRLNILANEGTLTLDGTIENSGNDMTYAASRANADGMNVTKNFNATSENGMIFIKNISGDNGMTFDGKINAGNAQAEIYNKKGDMTVSGSVEGKPAVVLNTGDKLVVNDSAKLSNNAVIVNRGSEAAVVPTSYKNIFKEKVTK